MPPDPGPGELELIDWLATVLPPPPPGETWIGDDAAVVRGDSPLLLAADAVVAGVHGDLGLISPADLGWKAMVANLSDLAAMGGQAGQALVTVSAPPGAPLRELFEGIALAAAQYGCPVVGGDLSSGPVLVVSVAVTGGLPDGRSPVLRGGARPGDQLWVTAPLGGSAAGLRLLRAGVQDGPLVQRHRRPTPRLAEGLAAAAAGARAMIDVSDGLGLDLWRLARASQVAAELDGIPVEPGATDEEALGGGEDYELIFATPPGSAVSETFAAAGLTPPRPIGWCGEDPAGRLSLRGTPIEPAGWSHPL